MERRAGAAGVGHYVPEFGVRSCAGAAGAAGVLGAVAAEAEHGADGERDGGASAGVESAALLHH